MLVLNVPYKTLTTKTSTRMPTPHSGGPSRTESDYMSLFAQVGSQHQNMAGSLHQFSPPVPEVRCTVNNLTIDRCCICLPWSWILRARTMTIDHLGLSENHLDCWKKLAISSEMLTDFIGFNRSEDSIKSTIRIRLKMDVFSTSSYLTVH